MGFLLLLGPLITLHELGHYLVGRWCGVRAEAFSIGFGKELVGWTDREGTRWKISILPLGGYVQFKGDMNPASVPDGDAIANASAEETLGSFHHASLGKRALIVLAGPVANILVTLAIFIGFFSILGNPVQSDPVGSIEVGEFAEESVAQEAGLSVGDQIVAVDDTQIDSFDTLVQNIVLFPGREVTLTVLRDGKELEFPLTIRAVKETDQFGNEGTVGRIGVAPATVGYDFKDVGIGEAIALSFDRTWFIAETMAIGIKQIVTGERSIEELGGPVKIAKYSGERLSLGTISFIDFAALISLNLAFINLLPIPGLDGGHLAFYAAEAVRRKPVGPRGMELAYRTGMALVIMLMLFVTFNDLASLSLFG
ncbi:MAG: RIP metalloprotease RseP [Erythrobacter sp.]|nr:RIP metalloprotease RseP [Erythrobacter sp.]RZV34870.1 MAG: RIP metalloprotease RseP [Sphingomonadaceae bacterium]